MILLGMGGEEVVVLTLVFKVCRPTDLLKQGSRAPPLTRGGLEIEKKYCLGLEKKGWIDDCI